jgi:hypothetical protein
MKEGQPIRPVDTATTSQYKDSLDNLEQFAARETFGIRNMTQLGIIVDTIGPSLQTFFNRNQTADIGPNGEVFEKPRFVSINDKNKVAVEEFKDTIKIDRYGDNDGKTYLLSSVTVPTSSTALYANVHFQAQHLLPRGMYEVIAGREIVREAGKMQTYLDVLQKSVRDLVAVGVAPTEEVPPLIVTISGIPPQEIVPPGEL